MASSAENSTSSTNWRARRTAVGRLVDALGATDPELVAKMKVGGREKHVNAWMTSPVERRPRAIDIEGCGAGEPGDDRPRQLSRDGAHRGEVTVGGDREPGLDDVHAEEVELPRHAQLLGGRHAESRRLLAVAQGRVENPDVDGVVHGALVSDLRVVSIKLIILLIELVYVMYRPCPPTGHRVQRHECHTS